ncbi:MAG: hypothetical protein K6C34_02670 [Alphaproteobacteria bacterium]|nr:hypothetical protein [Alphaproteobacteria bacterium]
MKFWHFLKRKLQIFHNHKGAILLEFAFSIPVLIMSLYFVLDVPHIYRLSNKMHKLSELYSQCILNVIRARDSKLLTLDDLKNISKGIRIGITGIVGNTEYPYALSTYIYYVKGESGAFKIIWKVHVQNPLNGTEISTPSGGTSYSSISGTSLTSLPGDWKDFTISEGEEKLVIETVLGALDEGNKPLKKMFYLLPYVGNKFGNQVSAITPIKGMLNGNQAPKDAT